MEEKNGNSGNSDKNIASSDSSGILSKQELIIKFDPDAPIRVDSQGKTFSSSSDKRYKDAADSINGLLKDRAVLKPLFGKPEELKLEAQGLASKGITIPDLSVYYRVSVTDKYQDNYLDLLNDLVNNFIKEDKIRLALESCYIKPPIALPRSLSRPTVSSADYSGFQGYLRPASQGGIDAHYAWSLPGGKGKGVNIVDVEWGWDFYHEDFGINDDRTIYGINLLDKSHGTEVIGILAAAHNNSGVDGICPEAMVYGAGVTLDDNVSESVAIYEAAKRLINAGGGPGDIILLEIQNPGPNTRDNNGDPKPYSENRERVGYIPPEWWPCCHDAIRYAVARGIIVVEAAGNGWENLDDKIYEEASYTAYRSSRLFPRHWNPFKNNPDSLAIMAGAGNPPPVDYKDIHAGNIKSRSGPTSTYVDRARCEYSNYGSRVDVQAWGWEVTTAFSESAQGGRIKYIDSFNGTSSAAAIVAGAIACVQGVLKSEGLPPLGPESMRKLLRETGSPQESAQGRPRTQRIGNRPDLAKLIPEARNLAQKAGDIKSTVIDILDEIMSEVKVTPLYNKMDQVTEVIIRCGSPDGLQILTGGTSQVITSDSSSSQSWIEGYLDSDMKALVEEIQKKTGYTLDQLISTFKHEITVQEIIEGLKKFAEVIHVNTS